ncbi:sensor histidine kinase [Alkaliphilus hydrothermalis]|uniref:histidine kinase n=1 Tax=Alkaliphilus hydrothermalis TaxID=1482730 RepID=A0ABS2NLP7_9FIRM|nr:HAMP domain-containing sensor histidine kinase [Alkaliphilus hydrothermalis]MBM7613859.1 signal transduction histidine kinase [Alkaliphilus hydrothermalis]
MGTILGINSKFISIRWKLLSTYLLLLVIALLIINIFVYERIKSNYITEKEISYITQGNIISNRVRLSVDEENKMFNQLVLSQMMEEVSRLVDGRILIVDRENTVMYDSFHDLKNSPINLYEVNRAMKGEQISHQYDLPKFGKVLYIGVPVSYYDDYSDTILGVVFLSVSLEDTYQRINNIKNLLFFISLITLLLITVISLLLSDMISEPIKELTEVMQKTAHGAMDQKVSMEGNDEIGQLSKAYNFMSTKLSHIEKQRQDFVANVSRELKTPLSSMKLLSESLLTQPDTPVEVYQEFLKDIDSEIDRLNGIIESLLAMVDMNEEKLKLDYQLASVNYLVEKVANSIRPLAHKKNIKIFINQWEKIQIYLDKGKIYQALMNIIHNAVKYTDEGGKVVISILKEGKYVVIRIDDNGIGIPTDSLPYIFERFYRVDSARSRKTGGSGLGLSISHQIISLHQGTVDVESTVNVGTTFYIRLPMELNP